MLKDCLDAFKDRIRNPFFGYFVLSWVIWNWELVYYILFHYSTSDVTAQIYHINEAYIGWWVNFFGPLITAGIAYILHQYLSIITVKFYYHIKTKLNNIKVDATKGIKYSQEDYSRISKKLSDLSIELVNSQSRLEDFTSPEEKEAMENKIKKLEKGIEESGIYIRQLDEEKNQEARVKITYFIIMELYEIISEKKYIGHANTIKEIINVLREGANTMSKEDIRKVNQSLNFIKTDPKIADLTSRIRDIFQRNIKADQYPELLEITKFLHQ